MGCLGLIALEEGDYATAESILETAVASSKADGDLRSEGTWLRGLGDLAIRRKQYRLAYDLLTGTVQHLRGVGDQVAMLDILTEWAGLAVHVGAYSIALCLAGGIEGQHERMGARNTPARAARLARWLVPAHHALPPAQVEEALAKGRSLSLQELLDLTAGDWGRFLTEVPSPAEPATVPVAASKAITSLTAREQEIIKLLAKGLTSREIGEQLYLSPRTIEKHEENIRNKLDVSNRAALVAWAAQHGIT